MISLTFGDIEKSDQGHLLFEPRSRCNFCMQIIAKAFNLFIFEIPKEITKLFL